MNEPGGRDLKSLPPWRTLEGKLAPPSGAPRPFRKGNDDHSLQPSTRCTHRGDVLQRAMTKADLIADGAATVYGTLRAAETDPHMERVD